ncbi:hypothetical protein F4776DRAFT_675155 [Hypoxylon sp. NC0597]|nr:hypothetical protein F4776DRAFT_675155 [Hypoxylon sp. NC0597]
MVQLSYVLLVCTSLFALVLGAALPSLQPVGIKEFKCEPASQKCHNYVLFRCNTLGAWVGVGPCQLPSLCEEDVSTGDAGCVKSDLNAEIDVGDESNPDILAAMPSPGPTPAPVPSAPTACEENDIRCNGNMEEMCDECTACIEEAGSVDCAPHGTTPSELRAHRCDPGDIRCNGDSLEICNDQRHWRHLVPCRRCEYPGTGSPVCEGPIPFPTRLVPPSKPLAQLSTQPLAQPFAKLPAESSAVVSCRGGEVKCNGDRLMGCTASSKWEDFGPCLNCKKLYNTRASCTFLETDDDVLSIVGPFPVLARDQSTSLFKPDGSPVLPGTERCKEDKKRCN